jgi:hypothetical protein
VNNKQWQNRTLTQNIVQVQKGMFIAPVKLKKFDFTKKIKLRVSKNHTNIILILGKRKSKVTFFLIFYSRQIHKKHSQLQKLITVHGNVIIQYR